MKEFIIDPRLKYNYASWYLLGIEAYAKEQNAEVLYDVKPFVGLKYADVIDYNSGFAFIVKEDGREKRIFIATEDKAKIFPERYAWSDVYGMVNPTAEQVNMEDKLVPIGPEFGITLTNRFKLFFICLKHYLQARKHTYTSFQLLFRDYLYTIIRRRPLDVYLTPTEVKPNYIFHASTLWYNEFADTDTNFFRGEFLKACQKVGLELEGGLYYLDHKVVHEQMPDYSKYKTLYKDFIYENRLSMDDYIRKTKESVLVFNTPSVCSCHGWKLAEYLCMGKAIISTPLTREMPGKGLIHGEHVHFVNDVAEIEAAVRLINTDATYRQKLEQGAQAYFEEWLAPRKVIECLINL